MSEADQLANTSPLSQESLAAPGVIDGPEFVLAPRHRLFAIFDEPHQALQAITQLAAEGLVSSDVWVYAGEDGAAAIAPALTKHGPGAALVRLVQRMLTTDCEYCERLSKATLNDATVIAAEVEPSVVEVARALLENVGGHSLAYGEHWNFVTVDDAASTSHEAVDATSNSSSYAADGAADPVTRGQ